MLSAMEHKPSNSLSSKNSEPIRNAQDFRKSHLKIRITDKVHQNLRRQNVTLETIPKKNAIIQLRNVSNVSQGGDAIDVTDSVHPSVIKLALKAIRAIPGLSFAGIDFMTKAIDKTTDRRKLHYYWNQWFTWFWYSWLSLPRKKIVTQLKHFAVVVPRITSTRLSDLLL